MASTTDRPLDREIERKYLLEGLPDTAAAAPSVEIVQGYLPGTKIVERIRRARQAGTTRFIRTIKLGKGVSRIEIEESMTEQLFDALWPLTEGRRIRKRRYLVPDGNLIWEIDEFLDQPLVLGEIELPDERHPTIPQWLAPHVTREVTDEPAFTNVRLAR
jgi:CYTH domain-containing protein